MFEVIRGLATLFALVLMKKVERDRQKAAKRMGKNRA